MFFPIDTRPGDRSWFVSEHELRVVFYNLSRARTARTSHREFILVRNTEALNRDFSIIATRQPSYNACVLLTGQSLFQKGDVLAGGKA